MEYLIKYNFNSKGKKRAVFKSANNSLITISEKLDSLSGKEIICNKTNQIIYLVDTLKKRDYHLSTIYDTSSNEILTIYLSSTYSGSTLYISSVNKLYAVTHKNDMSAIQLHKNGAIAATIRLKKNLFGTSYALDIKPQKDEEFIYIIAIIITKLLEYNVYELQTSAQAY